MHLTKYGFKIWEGKWAAEDINAKSVSLFLDILAATECVSILQFKIFVEQTVISMLCWKIYVCYYAGILVFRILGKLGRKVGRLYKNSKSPDLTLNYLEK